MSSENVCDTRDTLILPTFSHSIVNYNTSRVNIHSIKLLYLCVSCVSVIHFQRGIDDTRLTILSVSDTRLIACHRSKTRAQKNAQNPTRKRRVSDMLKMPRCVSAREVKNSESSVTFSATKNALKNRTIIGLDTRRVLCYNFDVENERAAQTHESTTARRRE